MNLGWNGLSEFHCKGYHIATHPNHILGISGRVLGRCVALLACHIFFLSVHSCLSRFSSLLEIMLLYRSWTLHSEPFSLYICRPQLNLGVLVYHPPRSVICFLYAALQMVYSKYSSSLGFMIVGAQKRLLLQESPPQSLHFLHFLLPMLWRVLEDTVQ